MPVNRTIRMRWIGGVAGLAVMVAAILLVRTFDARASEGRRRPSLPGATLEQVDTPGGPMLIVTSIETGSAPGNALKVGDSIDRIDRVPTRTTAALRRTVAHATGKTLEIQLWRDGRPTRISMGRQTGG